MVKYAVKTARYGASGDPKPGFGLLQTPFKGKVSAKQVSIFIPLFIIALAVPVSFFVGPLRLSVYRLVLLVAFIPAVVALLSGANGKTRLPDLLVIFSAFWGGVALVFNHGVEFSIEPFGIYFLETFGAYFLARMVIHDAQSFHAMARWFFLVIVILLPFAIYEMMTARPIILDILNKVFTVLPNVPKEPRWGLDRVQGPFEHPILFGVFCSSIFALSIFVLGFGKKFFGQIVRGFTVIFAVFMSLSSGPLSALFAQMGLILWEKGLRRIRHRWAIFFTGFIVLYVIIDIISNRTPLKVFISYTAFNLETAYGRILIWEVGSKEVVRNPIFGIGNKLWDHGPDLTASLDMFWLVNAVSYGLPGGISIFLATVLIVIKLGRLKLSDPLMSSYRMGIAITIAGMTIAGWGVHFWNATYVQFMFLLGSGVWMLNENEVDKKTKKTAKSGKHQLFNHGVSRM